MKILVLGDVHMEFGKLNQLISKKQPDILIACGDFGYWPNLIEEKVSYGWGGIFSKYVKKETNCLAKIKPGKTKIYWICGNHEDHSSLNKYQNGNIHELVKNIFFCSRGSTLTLPDGRNILFIGGAYSIDKDQRTEGIDWFREETISYKDYERAISHNKKIDIVVSHTCPEYFIPDLIQRNISKIYDPSCKALDGIFDKYKPNQWFFGHFHFYKEGDYNGCHWNCLNYLGNQISGKSFIQLK
jgi:Icc-related predicted phosphoesterase